MTKAEIDQLPEAVVYFTADWCKPCQTFKPVFNKVGAEYSVPKIIINVGEFHNVAQEYNVRGIPCVLFLKAGVVISRVDGANEPELKKGFEQLK